MTQKVVECWWEGNDFLTKTEDGEVTRYENAEIVNVRDEAKPEGVLRSVPATFVPIEWFEVDQED